MQNPLKVLSLIIDKDDPSSRARILQYLPELKKEEITVIPKTYHPTNNADPAAWMYQIGKLTGVNPWRFLWFQKRLSRLPLLLLQNKFDLLWQNRMIITHQSWYENKLKTPRIFDFDDAIWLHDGEKHVQEAISSAIHVFAGNEYLADYASRFSKNTTIIPSVINTAELYPEIKKDRPFTIGWIGSASNIQYLAPVKPAIEQFLQKHPDSRFHLVSSSPGNLFKFDGRKILFSPWSAKNERTLINEFSIGLMPLPDTNYTKGKCSYKMLQYMACGVPVLVSPVGTNITILKKSETGLAAVETNEWLRGLEKLKIDSEFYSEASQKGPAFIEKEYSVKKFAPIISNIFRTLIHI